jgi:methionine-rich copper-binding protein CopC
MNRITRIVAAAGVIAVAAAPAAFGHAKVVRLSPKAGSTVSRSLHVVSMKLSEGVLGGSLKVYNSKGKVVSKHSSLRSGKTLLRATVSGLRGHYTAKATWVADDGDKQSKTWRFTVR